jgi:hypothetical protein
MDRRFERLEEVQNIAAGLPSLDGLPTTRITTLERRVDKGSFDIAQGCGHDGSTLRRTHLLESLGGDAQPFAPSDAHVR